MSGVIKYAGKIRQPVIITSPKYECSRRVWREGNHLLGEMTAGGISYYVFVCGMTPSSWGLRLNETMYEMLTTMCSLHRVITP